MKDYSFLAESVCNFNVGGKMQDYLIRGLSNDISIRFFIAVTTEMAEEARRIHNTSPAVTVAMGKFLAISAIMGNNLKSENDKLTLQIKGDGPIKEIVAVADSKGNIKAFPGNPDAMVGKNHKVIVTEKENGSQESVMNSEYSMQTLIGKEGMLTVIKDFGLKEPYVGKVPLADGSISGDFMAYFAVSEQIPTFINLETVLDEDGHVLVSGGYMLQVLPGAGDEEISTIEKNLGKGIELAPYFLQGKTPEQIAEIIMKDLEYKIALKAELRYLCGCDRDRMARMLIGTGVDELKSMIREQGSAEVHCHFCNTKHGFSKKELTDFVKIAESNSGNALQ